ncbi:hypothetical protein EDEG_00714 [Edhazardia aedis USNM 41457]|uniref:Condensin complex subunit 1 C-terminal domain-containing protein n=1 Tax=Edhazardia aedis (strain USNM 41457) TaxID=1003232 RepID=J9DCQ6_EDHAE|nr:hypothetical protein EDEG_00714 [Edhazardia aedis USNM 41457]|eukprot:EJW05249.1 hypothetical protein EDEG_00714 [Edhazardia aedis USNM 41457]
MLPGVSIYDFLPIHECSALSMFHEDLIVSKVKKIDNYFFNYCSEECKNALYVFFLKNNLTVDKKMLNNESALIRKISHKKSKNNDDILKLINDPNLDVKLYAIAEAKPFRSFFNYLNDSNCFIRLEVLKKIINPIYLKSLNNSDYTILFGHICDLINDSYKKIRILASKSLKLFNNISQTKILELLSKTDEKNEIKPGTFVHGFEDECDEVRFYTIESICSLTKNNEIAIKAFDFLTDSLNDEISAVKEHCSIWILRITKKYDIKSNMELLDTLFSNLREKNDLIKKNVYFTIACLKYDDECIQYCVEKFEKLIDRRIDLDMILKTLIILVQKNHEYFLRLYEKISKHKNKTTFLDTKKIMLIDNMQVFFNVMIIQELISKGYRIDYPQQIKKNLFYYVLKKRFVYDSIGIDNNILAENPKITKKNKKTNKRNLKLRANLPSKFQKPEIFNQLENPFDDILNVSKKRKLSKKEPKENNLHQNCAQNDKSTTYNENYKEDDIYDRLNKNSENILTSSEQPVLKFYKCSQEIANKKSNITKNILKSDAINIFSEKTTSNKKSILSFKSIEKDPEDIRNTNNFEPLEKKFKKLDAVNFFKHNDDNIINTEIDNKQSHSRKKDKRLCLSSNFPQNFHKSDINDTNHIFKSILGMFIDDIYKCKKLSCLIKRYKNNFAKSFYDCDISEPYRLFFDAICKIFKVGDDKPLKAFCIKFNVLYTDNSTKKKLLDILEIIDRCKKHVLYITCPTKIFRKFNLPLQFELPMHISSNISDVFIKVKGKKTSSVYKAEEKTSIVFFDKISKILTVYAYITLDDSEIILSEKHKIIIENMQSL